MLRHTPIEDFRLVLAPVIVAESRRIIAHKFPAYRLRIDEFFQRWPYELQRDPSPAEIAANQALLRDPMTFPSPGPPSMPKWTALSPKTNTSPNAMPLRRSYTDG